MRVLIVEDDASARRGLTELVRAWGHEAEGAADGQEGLEQITTYRPSAVLADMVMPRMDGLELLRRVKEQLGDLTFVLITAQGSVDTAVAAMKEGAYDYLTKPVDPQRLRTSCRTFPSARTHCATSRASAGSSRTTAVSARWSATRPLYALCIA